MPLASLLGSRPLSVTSLASHKQILPFQMLMNRQGACVCSRIPWASSTDSPVRLGVCPTATPPQDFTARGLETLVSCAGTLGCVVCLAPQLFLLAQPQVNVGYLSLQATTLPSLVGQLPCCASSLPRLPNCPTPTNLDACFFFNFWFWTSMQFDFLEIWLVFVFKLVVILLLVVQASKTYLPTPPSWLEPLQLIF